MRGFDTSVPSLEPVCRSSFHRMTQRQLEGFSRNLCVKEKNPESGNFSSQILQDKPFCCLFQLLPSCWMTMKLGVKVGRLPRKEVLRKNRK